MVNCPIALWACFSSVTARAIRNASLLELNNALIKSHPLQVPLYSRYQPEHLTEVIQQLRNLIKDTLGTSQPPPKIQMEQKLRNYHNSQYFGEISLGKGSKKFVTIFDTGSSNIWVPASECTSGGCAHHARYDAHASETFEPLYNDDNQVASVYIQYGTGSCVLILGQETVSLGDLRVDKQLIGLAVEESKYPFADMPFDGLVGLGFAESSSKHQLPPDAVPILDNIKRSNLLSRNLFAVYVQEDLRLPGSISFGAANSKYVYPGHKPVWFPLINTDYWTVEIAYIKVGETKLRPCSHPPCKAAVDTGSSLITGSSTLIRDLSQLINVQPDCSNLSSAPNIYINLVDMQGNIVEFPLEPRDYILEAVNDSGKSFECEAGFMPMDIPSPRGPLVVLGNSFIRRYYAIFDKDHLAVGFMRAKHETLAEEEPRGPSPLTYLSSLVLTVALAVFIVGVYRRMNGL